jgi:hypothetical protein
VLDEANNLAIRWGVPVAIAFMAVAVRIVMSADRWTLIGVARGLMVGTLVGWIAILWVWELNTMSLGMRGCIVGASACLAEDVVMGLLTIGKKLRDDPAAVIEMVTKWRRPS